MSAASNAFVVQRNGQTANASALAPLAFAGFAHFTAMQVREAQIRGLDLHLKRLHDASMTLFGRAVPDEQMRSYLRTSLERGPSQLSLVATVYSAAGEFTTPTTDGADAALEVLVRTSLASSGPSGPLAMATVEYERILPAVKHVGEVAKTYFLHKAVEQGFDDAIFLDRRGRLSEGTIWNLAFWDGSAVVWPEADMLTGTTMSILRRQLDRLGIAQRVQEITLADLPSLAGGVVMNSWTPGIPISRIGATLLPDAPGFLELLHRAYQAEPATSP